VYSGLLFTARCYAWRGLCRRKMPVRLSVRLSHASILSKRLYISSNLFHRRVATLLQFLHTKRDGNISTGTPSGPSNARGMQQSLISTNISLYVGNNTRQSHCYYGRLIGNRTQAFGWYQLQ